MNRDVLVALITTTRNRYIRGTTTGSKEIMYREDIIKDLNDILGYEARAEEPTKVQLNMNDYAKELEAENDDLNLKISRLRYEIPRIEKNCDDLHRQIKELKSDNQMWQRVCIELREKNEGLEKDNKMLQESRNLLRNKGTEEINE